MIEYMVVIKKNFPNGVARLRDKDGMVHKATRGAYLEFDGYSLCHPIASELSGPRRSRRCWTEETERREAAYATGRDVAPNRRCAEIVSDSEEGGMVASEDIALDRQEQVAVLTLRRAHCLDIGGKRALTEIFTDLGSNLGSTRAVIICATHPASWLVNVEELSDMPSTEARIFSHHGHQLARAIADLPVPVIAAVDAPALGGGCELVLACDLALAGDQAKFGQIEAMGGVMPAFGGMWRLEERVGYQRAVAMMFTGEVADAETALRYGLVLEVHRSSDLLQAAGQIAQRIAACSPQPVAAIKRVTRAGRGIPAAARDQFEEEAFPTLFGAEQHGRMHAFLQQQKTK